MKKPVNGRMHKQTIRKTRGKKDRKKVDYIRKEISQIKEELVVLFY